MENNDELIYITNEPSEETSQVESEATESNEEQVSQENEVEQEENSETVSEPEVPESTEQEAEDNKAESENEEEEQEHEEDHKPKKNSYKRRIDKLKSVISEKDEQIKALEEALNGNQVPNVSDYEDPQAYLDAITNQKVAEQIRNMEQKRLEAEQAKLLELQRQSMQEQIAEALKNPDIQKAVETENLPVSGLMEQMLLESDNAGALFAYLVKNPKKCQTIAKLSDIDPRAAYKEMLKLEAKVELEIEEVVAKPKTEVKKKPVVSKAPEPQKPVKGSAPKIEEHDGFEYF